MRKLAAVFSLVILYLISSNGLSRAAPNDAIVPGLTRADVTFEHIGVVWSIDGDLDLDSSMSLEFRRVGEPDWHPAAPAMRAYPTISVDGAPLV
jgi:hypothetical protein